MTLLNVPCPSNLRPLHRFMSFSGTVKASNSTNRLLRTTRISSFIEVAAVPVLEVDEEDDMPVMEGLDSRDTGVSWRCFAKHSSLRMHVGLLLVVKFFVVVVVGCGISVVVFAVPASLVVAVAAASLTSFTTGTITVRGMLGTCNETVLLNSSIAGVRTVLF